MSTTSVAAGLVSLVLLVGCTNGATPSLTPSQDPTAAASASPTPPTPAQAPGPGAWVEVRGVPTGAGKPVVVPADGGRVLLLDAAEPCYFPGELSPEEFRPSPAEVFDPGTQEFSQTASFDKPRFGFVGLSLLDGRVLVAGGHNEQGVPKSSTRIWDPVTGTWSEGGLMTLARDRPIAVLLHDGRVLVAGGDTSSQVPTGTAEIYDAAADDWMHTGSLQSDNAMAAAVRLSDGRVLALQLTDLDAAVFGGGLYDPGRGTWAVIDGPPGRWNPAISLVALPDGTALLIGGSSDVLRYDPAVGWSSAGKLTTSRPGATATLLRDGRVLVAGGRVGSGSDGTARVLKTAELFDPRTGQSSEATSMPADRLDGVATLLEDGSVLLAGGASDAWNGDTPWCPTLVETAVRWIP